MHGAGEVKGFAEAMRPTLPASRRNWPARLRGCTLKRHSHDSGELRRFVYPHANPCREEKNDARVLGQSMTHRRIEPLRRGEKSATRHEAGRVCESPACETHLSIYNSSNFCSLHEGVAAPRPFDPGSRPSLTRPLTR